MVMRSMKMAVAVAAAVALGRGTGGAASPDPAKPEAGRVAFIDLATLFMKSEVGKAQIKKFEDEARAKEKDLLPKQETIEGKLQGFEARRSLLSPKGIEEAQKEMQAMMGQFQKEVRMMRADLVKKEQEYTKEVVKYIFDVVKEVATAEKYDYVFEKQALLFGGDNITEKVLKVADEKYKKRKK